MKLWQWIKQGGYLVYKAGDNLIEHDGIELAGYMTFLSLLALFPFLVLIVATAGFIGQGELGAQFIALLIEHLPQEAVVAIKPRVEEIMSGPPQGLLTVSIMGAIWTSSSAVEGLRTVLNRAYQVSNPPTYIFRRMMSIMQLILFTLLVIVVLLAIVLFPLIPEYLNLTMKMESPLALWNRYFFYIGAFVLFLIVSSLYYFLPNIRQSLLAVVPGAALAVVLWLNGAELFTLYITNVDQVSIIYGSLGGFIATLLFFFLLNIILIYGAEFNHMILIATGARVEEREHAAHSEEIELTNHGSSTGRHSRQAGAPKHDKE